jgi:hypothetical protein
MQRQLALLQRVAQARNAENNEVQQIFLSTLPTAPWPFEQVAVVRGIAAPDAESALYWLRVEAQRVGANAVLGVEYSREPGSWDDRGRVLASATCCAYGTAVRRTGPAQLGPAGNGSDAAG